MSTNKNNQKTKKIQKQINQEELNKILENK